MSAALSNYLSDCFSCLASTFTLERYGPRILAQHVNDGENVMLTFVETWVRMHLNDIGLPQIIVSSNYDVSSRKIFSRWSVQLLDESPLFGTDDVFIGSHVRLQLSISWYIIMRAIKLHYDLFHFCHSFCRFYRFLIVCLSFFSVIFQ